VISTDDPVINRHAVADGQRAPGGKSAPGNRRAEDPKNPGTHDEEAVCAVARLLADHRCENPVVLDISSVSDAADYFVIATVRSSTHLAGVYGYLMTYCKEHGIEPLGGSKRVPNNPWLLVDFGNIVVHLMEGETREFYELERLWFNGRIVPVPPDQGSRATESPGDDTPAV